MENSTLHSVQPKPWFGSQESYVLGWFCLLGFVTCVHILPSTFKIFQSPVVYGIRPLKLQKWPKHCKIFKWDTTSETLPKSQVRAHRSKRTMLGSWSWAWDQSKSKALQPQSPQTVPSKGEKRDVEAPSPAVPLIASTPTYLSPLPSPQLPRLGTRGGYNICKHFCREDRTCAPYLKCFLSEVPHLEIFQSLSKHSDPAILAATFFSCDFLCGALWASLTMKVGHSMNIWISSKRALRNPWSLTI